MIALIGGSGVKDSPEMKGATWDSIDTGFSNGWGDGRVYFQKSGDVIFIPRHGHLITFGPSRTQYGANLIAAKMLGADMICATSAVGSYRPQIGVECLVIPDDYVDESGRDDTLYGIGIVEHVNPRPAFSDNMSSVLYDCAQDGMFSGKLKKGTIVVIPGDRFGTRAEGIKRSQYADLVGMTICPEASMALQLGLPYAAALFVVDNDFDANHEGGTLAVMQRLSEPHRVPQYISNVIEGLRALRPADLAVTQLSGNIIPGDLERITNPNLRRFAAELQERYCH